MKQTFIRFKNQISDLNFEKTSKKKRVCGFFSEIFDYKVAFFRRALPFKFSIYWRLRPFRKKIKIGRPKIDAMKNTKKADPLVDEGDDFLFASLLAFSKHFEIIQVLKV